ncbi:MULTISPECIES: hypothetical protein [Bacillus]|uniref:hypothetical protein n=1 Tax=Bacillus TaxID=1386 RepID=UPI001CD7C687|nr:MULTISPECIES: hypothetical protein [Bacillus amyloliquefaciens group]WBY46499.1 hypothetical protein PF996_03510 [Bacillus velezensis]
MKNKIKVVIKFILETIVSLLPLCISYILLSMWLSNVTDFGRTFVVPSGTDFKEVYGSAVKYGWIEFDTLGQGIKNYNFEVSKVFWGGLISVILLVLIGKLIYIVLVRLLEKRVKIKRLIEKG